jgi:hypothetical protein
VLSCLVAHTTRSDALCGVLPVRSQAATVSPISRLVLAESGLAASG